jgi:hypothetical protein
MKLSKNNNALIWMGGGVIIILIIFIYIFNNKNFENFITNNLTIKKYKENPKKYKFFGSCKNPLISGNFLKATCKTSLKKTTLVH